MGQCHLSISSVLLYIFFRYYLFARLQSMATFEKMWNEIDIGHRARREVLMLRDKLQESESLVATTTEAVSAEAHKLRDQLEGSS